MIKRFMIPDRQIVQSYMVRYLTNDIVSHSILENNKSFELMRDEARQATILYCENKPRDLLVYGLKWEVL